MWLHTYRLTLPRPHANAAQILVRVHLNASCRFADYRVPVVLRQMGILAYSADLALKVCISETALPQRPVTKLNVSGAQLAAHGSALPLYRGTLDMPEGSFTSYEPT